MESACWRGVECCQIVLLIALCTGRIYSGHCRENYELFVRALLLLLADCSLTTIHSFIRLNSKHRTTSPVYVNGGLISWTMVGYYSMEQQTTPWNKISIDYDTIISYTSTTIICIRKIAMIIWAWWLQVYIVARAQTGWLYCLYRALVCEAIQNAILLLQFCPPIRLAHFDIVAKWLNKSFKFLHHQMVATWLYYS